MVCNIIWFQIEILLSNLDFLRCLFFVQCPQTLFLNLMWIKANYNPPITQFWLIADDTISYQIKVDTVDTFVKKWNDIQTKTQSSLQTLKFMLNLHIYESRFQMKSVIFHSKKANISSSISDLQKSFFFVLENSCK